MSHTSSYIPDGTIESATAFFCHGSPTSAPRPAPHAPQPFSKQQQSAMARRLEQLQAALGDGEVHRARPDKPITPPTSSRPLFGASQLLLTGLLAAMLGAGAIWLNQSHQSAAIEPLQASSPSVVTPAPLPPATLNMAEPESKISDEQKIVALVDAWRSAWQGHDIAGYLAAYSAAFMPTDGASREAWQLARQKKLASGAAIDIRIHDLQIERIDSHQFKASFLQDYASGNYRETARRKSLLITQDADEWKIVREWQE